MSEAPSTEGTDEPGISLGLECEPIEGARSLRAVPKGDCDVGNDILFVVLLAEYPNGDDEGL